MRPWKLNTDIFQLRIVQLKIFIPYDGAKAILSQCWAAPNQALKCKQPIYLLPFTPINHFVFHYQYSICRGSVQFPQFCLTAAKIWSDRWTQCYSSVLSGKQRKIHPQGVRAGRPKRHEEKRARGSILFPLFISFFFFLLPLSLPSVNWASQEAVCFTWGPHSGSWAFPFFVF